MKCGNGSARDCCECTERICLARPIRIGYDPYEAEESEEYDYE